MLVSGLQKIPKKGSKYPSPCKLGFSIAHVADCAHKQAKERKVRRLCYQMREPFRA